MKIPQGSFDDKSIKPAWLPLVNSEGQAIKPVIRCACGRLSSIRLHHVHADGRVTASFYHVDAACGFHEMLELDGWDGGDFPSEP